MKTLKKVLIVVAVVVAIPLIAALFVDGAYKTQKEITIKRTRSEVFEYIKHIKNQDHYSVWAMADPAALKSYSGEDGSIGFISRWDSEIMGKGEQEIREIEPGKGIAVELRFLEPWEGIAHARMETEESGDDNTLVKWGFESKMPYPMNIMLLFVDMNEMMGKDLETGLNNLKATLEGGVKDQI